MGWGDRRRETPRTRRRAQAIGMMIDERAVRFRKPTKCRYLFHARSTRAYLHAVQQRSPIKTMRARRRASVNGIRQDGGVGTRRGRLVVQRKVVNSALAHDELRVSRDSVRNHKLEHRRDRGILVHYRRHPERRQVYDAIAR